MDIEIHTYDIGLAFELLGKSCLSAGDEIQVADQTKLKYNGTIGYRSIDIPDIVELTLTLASGMATGVAANWLYDKLKNKRIKKLIIERTEVQIDQGEIKKIIEEKLKIE